MPRKKIISDPLTPAQVKDAADRAEGIKPAPTKLGRPTEYQPSFIVQAEKLCSLGATDMEMAAFFEVAVSTFYKWKHDYPDFSEAQRVAKEAADNRVERSLYNRAVGYTFETEKVFQYQGDIVRATTLEHVPPETTACIFWLKNRRKEQWRDVQRHEHGGVGDFDRMADDELIDEIQRMQEEASVALPASDTEH